MKEQWTYEVPPAGAGASGLEDYQVETRDGEVVGKIISVLDREGDRYLAFDTGLPPVARQRRAVPWEDIVAIDHDALTVRIGLAKAELGQVLELDPANQVENGEADAVRLTDLPTEVTATDPSARGPIDRSSYALAIALFAGGLLMLRPGAGRERHDLHLGIRPFRRPGSPFYRCGARRIPRVPAAIREVDATRHTGVCSRS